MMVLMVQVALAAAAALQEFGQRVSELRQLEDLAVQQLQQRAEALAEGFPLLLAALQTLPEVAQLGLQRLVPRLRVLKQNGRFSHFKRYLDRSATTSISFQVFRRNYDGRESRESPSRVCV